jgi:putative tricarboxylic transport membrane protein
VASGKKNLLSGIFFFIFGLLLAFESLELSIWTEFGPSEGFFPLTIAVVTIGLSLAIIIKSFTSPVLQEREESLERPDKKAVSKFRVISYALLMLLYALLMEAVGFLITSSLFVIFILRYVEGRSWKKAILIGLTSTILGYLIFVYSLKVPLPKGFVSRL